MKSTYRIKKTTIAAVILLMMFCGVNSAAAKNLTDTGADTWQYEITIYGWLPTIDGKLKYDVPPGSGDNVTVDASDILDSLNFVLMGIFEARYNKMSYAIDLLYMDVSNTENTTITLGPRGEVPVDVSAGLGLSTWLVTGTVGYDVVQTDKSRTAVLAGVRYLTLDADVNLTVNGPPPPTPPPNYVSGSKDFWDAIIGVKGGFMLNEKWYIPYYADIGAGGSNLTWQLYAGIGYLFHWGDIKLGYRYLGYDQDSDKLVQDLKFYGPMMGIGFRF